MARVDMTSNSTSSPVPFTGGLASVGVKGDLGSGEVAVQFQTDDMVAANDWLTVTSETSGVLNQLAIDTVDMPVAVPLPSCKMRFVLSGATAPSIRIYVDAVRR